MNCNFPFQQCPQQCCACRGQEDRPPRQSEKKSREGRKKMVSSWFSGWEIWHVNVVPGCTRKLGRSWGCALNITPISSGLFSQAGVVCPLCLPAEPSAPLICQCSLPTPAAKERAFAEATILVFAVSRFSCALVASWEYVCGYRYQNTADTWQPLLASLPQTGCWGSAKILGTQLLPQNSLFLS